MSSYRLSGGGDAVLQSQRSYGQSDVPGATTDLETFNMSGETYVISTGLQSSELRSFNYSASGNFSELATFSSDVSFGESMRDVTCLMVEGSMILYSAHSDTQGLAIYEVASNQTMTYMGQHSLTNDVNGDDVAGMASVTNANGSFLFVGSFAEDNITSYRINSEGSLTYETRIGAEEGLGINTITAISNVSNDFGDFILVASGDSSSISVLRVGANGTLTAVDHVIDDLTTRFQGATSLEALQFDGRTYVLAGVEDDGLSLFTLLPDGRLHLLSSVEDTMAMSLQNISAVTMAGVDGELQIFAASGVEAGITQLTVDVGDVGATLRGSSGGDILSGTLKDDILFGADGNDDISGGNGDDILIDGDGQDMMQGGAGQDTFVFTEDGKSDTISDFDVANDTLDLSGFQLFRSIDQLTVTTTSTGAILTYNDEVIHLTSNNGQPIYYATLAGMTIVNATHTPVTWILPEGAKNGSKHTDVMDGTDAVDILYGLGGTDTLRGFDGDDTLDGGDQDDVVIGLRGADYLLGGSGQDLVSYAEDAIHGGTAGVVVNLKTGEAIGGFGNTDTLEAVEDIEGTDFSDYIVGNETENHLIGGGGDDQIFGDAGKDDLDGGDGSDRLYGGSGKDLILGGDENDLLEGESGSDTLYGEFGDDELVGGDGEDRLFGGDGKDRLFGNEDDDDLDGGVGDDLLSGGGGGDNLYGGLGNDHLKGNSGNDNLDGGDGSDRLYGGSGRDLILGGDENDLLEGEFGSDTLYGVHGDDELLGGDGSDRLYGGSGNDQISGGNQNDLLEGESGSDTLCGEHGDDELLGGEGKDHLVGGDGKDKLFGNEDDDVLEGEAGDDELNGGGGGDKLHGGSGKDSLKGYSGSDKLNGGSGDDCLDGGTGSDKLTGGSGDDALYGRDGKDQIYGGSGDDKLIGGKGDDVLDGGSGADKFKHSGYSGHGKDRVSDFSDYDGDQLVFLRNVLINDFEVKYGHSSNSKGERFGDDSVKEAFIIYKPSGDVIWTLDDGAGENHIDITLDGSTYDLLA